jgi:hypothetical protein
MAEVSVSTTELHGTEGKMSSCTGKWTRRRRPIASLLGSLDLISSILRVYVCGHLKQPVFYSSARDNRRSRARLEIADGGERHHIGPCSRECRPADCRLSNDGGRFEHLEHPNEFSAFFRSDRFSDCVTAHVIDDDTP